MSSVFDRFGKASAAPARNDTSAAITAAKRRRVWHVVVGANVTALVAAIAGCLFMMRTQGIRAIYDGRVQEEGLFRVNFFSYVYCIRSR